MRKITLAACGTALALVLAGCGGTSGTSTPSSDGPASGTNGSAGFGSLKSLAEGMSSKSAEKQSTHMVFTMTAAGQSFEGEGDLRLGSAPAMQMVMRVPEMGEMTVLLVDDAFYLKLPTELQSGKAWLKADLTGDNELARSLGASVRQMKQNGDPSQLLKQLDAAGEITSTKQEDLNGVSTTHYSVIVDVEKLVASQADPDMKKMAEDAKTAGVTTIPIELWLDQENLPVRMTMDLAVSDPATKKTEKVTMTVDYSDWGKTVDITPPPADQVTEFPGN
jgi:hypothetical protein